MANHSKPTLTSNYTAFVDEIKGRLEDISKGFDPARTSATNVPNYSIRWSSEAKKWQYLDGSSWKDLAAEYAINISGYATKLKNARTIRTDLSSTSAPSFDGTGNITPGVTGTLPISRGGTGGATASSARTNLGLGSAATRNVGESAGNVMEVGAFGLGSGHNSATLGPNLRAGFYSGAGANETIVPNGWTGAYGPIIVGRRDASGRLGALIFGAGSRTDSRALGYAIYNSNAGEWYTGEICHTGNILKTTGNNDNFPMSQKAVTDALNNTSVSWGDISGKPSTATRWPTWGEVTSKPSSFNPSSHNHSASNITSGTLPGARMPNSAGGVGTYAFARYTGGKANDRLPWNSTTSGGNLRADSATIGTTYETALAGTWRQLGYGSLYQGGSSTSLLREYGLFLRIS